MPPESSEPDRNHPPQPEGPGQASPGSSSGFAASRRNFLKAVGVGTATGTLPAIAGAAALRQDEPKQDQLGGNNPPVVPTTQINVTINGKAQNLEIDSRATLLDTLRTKLGLTGAKKGCDHGACGACTCHVDGERVLGCLTLMATLDGKTVTSIEGLEEGGKLHPVQQAFLKCDGYQCGYCTPGQIMSGAALINEGHANSPEEIREWMSGNLCRCGAYPNIVDAIEMASGNTSGRKPAQNQEASK